MTEVNSHLGALIALVLGVAFMAVVIIVAACKSASLADRDMKRTFARMIPPEQQRIESPNDEIKCRGCGMLYPRREFTALGWCPTCSFMLSQGTHWACRKCGAVVLENALFKDECWECRQVDTTGE